LGWLWWIGLSIGLVCEASGRGSSISTEPTATSLVDDGYSMQALGSLVAAAALPCGAIYVRRLGTRLPPRGIIESPEMRLGTPR
jgi:hypothetical protein